MNVYVTLLADTSDLLQKSFYSLLFTFIHWFSPCSVFDWCSPVLDWCSPVFDWCSSVFAVREIDFRGGVARTGRNSRQKFSRKLLPVLASRSSKPRKPTEILARTANNNEQRNFRPKFSMQGVVPQLSLVAAKSASTSTPPAASVQGKLSAEAALSVVQSVVV